MKENVSTHSLSPKPILNPNIPPPHHSVTEKSCQLQHQFISLRLLGSTLTNSCLQNSAFSFFSQNKNEKQLPTLEVKSDNQLFLVSSDEFQHENKTTKSDQKNIETKNLNRYFRSKINEVLRDIKGTTHSKSELQKADYLLRKLNQSNKIMFSELQEIMKDEWLQQKFLKCSALLLKHVHAGKMGMRSKLVMLKYFNKILKAIRKPDSFTHWK